jgi:2-C-methyl-D-erythritol 2,4-cyclodiphosphate synthase
VAAALLQEELVMKIGHGFDAHRLVTGRKLILGGVTIPFELGLDGHSDADVVAHALTDALLGALGAGDIGRHFPDSDPQYKGINSLLLLAQVQQLAAARQYQLGNADITIVCQRPKLASYLIEMQANLARCCQVSPTAINIKATTTEKMGYTGRGEGIAAHAVVLLRADHGSE